MTCLVVVVVVGVVVAAAVVVVSLPFTGCIQEAGESTSPPLAFLHPFIYFYDKKKFSASLAPYVPN